MPRTSRSPARPGCDLSQPAGPARPPACSVRIMPLQPAARVPADLPPERHTAAGRSGGVLEWTFCAPARGAKRPTRGGIAALFAALGHYGSPTVGWLRRQPLDHPAADSPPVTDPVVQAVRRFLPELDAGWQHPEAAPALRTGHIGSAGVAAEYVLDLHFQDRPAGDDVALVRGCRAEADGGGACPSTGASSPLTRSTGPATGTWRCAGTSQCSTAAARGLGASSVTLSLSQSVKKTSPRWRPRSITRRAEGTASLVSLAIVMASGIGWPAVRAASSHLESWRSGSAPRSVIFTRPVWRPLRTVSDELLPPPPAAPELTGIMAQREVGVEHDPVHAVIGPVQQVPMPLGTSHRPPADRARLIAARQPNCPKGHSFRAKSQTERIGCLGR